MRALCPGWGTGRRFYNGPMRAALLLSLFLGCLGSGLAQAQNPATAPAGQDDKPASGKTEQRVENIRHEDAGSRIDELRVGGETKRITVQPKGDAPAYEIAPENANRSPATPERERSSGGWKIKSF